MTYKQFESKWLTRTVDYDKREGTQCIDLVKQYLDEEFGIKPGYWGNAVDYWNHTKPEVLAKFDRLVTTDTKEGDIVIFNGLVGNPNGHIGIDDGKSTTTMADVLEQNGHTGNGKGTDPGDKIRTRAITKQRILGVLRPKSPAHLETVKNPTTWNVRTAPNATSAVIGVVRKGDVYETAIVSGDWRKISFRGRQGFVSGKAF
jgi:hypothetical protein